MPDSLPSVDYNLLGNREDVEILELTGNYYVNDTLESELSWRDFDKKCIDRDEREEERRHSKFIKHKYKYLRYTDDVLFHTMMLEVLIKKTGRRRGVDHDLLVQNNNNEECIPPEAPRRPCEPLKSLNSSFHASSRSLSSISEDSAVDNSDNQSQRSGRTQTEDNQSQRPERNLNNNNYSSTCSVTSSQDGSNDGASRLVEHGMSGRNAIPVAANSMVASSVKDVSTPSATSDSANSAVAPSGNQNTAPSAPSRIIRHRLSNRLLMSANSTAQNQAMRARRMSRRILAQQEVQPAPESPPTEETNVLPTRSMEKCRSVSFNNKTSPPMAQPPLQKSPTTEEAKTLPVRSMEKRRSVSFNNGRRPSMARPTLETTSSEEARTLPTLPNRHQSRSFNLNRRPSLARPTLEANSLSSRSLVNRRQLASTASASTANPRRQSIAFRRRGTCARLGIANNQPNRPTTARQADARRKSFSAAGLLAWTLQQAPPEATGRHQSNLPESRLSPSESLWQVAETTKVANAPVTNSAVYSKDYNKQAVEETPVKATINRRPTMSIVGPAIAAPEKQSATPAPVVTTQDTVNHRRAPAHNAQAFNSRLEQDLGYEIEDPIVRVGIAGLIYDPTPKPKFGFDPTIPGANAAKPLVTFTTYADNTGEVASEAPTNLVACSRGYVMSKSMADSAPDDLDEEIDMKFGMHDPTNEAYFKERAPVSRNSGGAIAA